MNKLTLAIFIALSGPAMAQSSGLKPGLWEIKPIRQVVDGHDMTSQMAAAQTRMRQAMANLPPEQRKQVEAMMRRRGASLQRLASGRVRICISAAMAARDVQIVDPRGTCEPARVTRTGNKASFEFSCTADGRTTVGKGESTSGGDTVLTRLDMTVTDPRGSHTMHSETQMTYVGADCHGIKPADQLVKEALPRKSGRTAR